MTQKQLFQIIKKVLSPLARSIQLSIGRCILQAIDDDLGIQGVKVSLLEGEVKEMERFQNYGFTSSPSSDAEGVCLFVGGNREHGICIALDNRKFRLKGLSEGQVALYDESGSKVLLKNDGTIELGQGILEKILNGETFQSWFNEHKHTGNAGYPTSSPIAPSLPIHLSSQIKGGI